MDRVFAHNRPIDRRSGRKPVEGLRGGVDLIVVGSVGKAEQFIQIGRKPWRIFWEMDLPGLEARRLSQEPRHLSRSGRLAIARKRPVRCRSCASARPSSVSSIKVASAL